MEVFDLHPKAVISARKRTVPGGILTTITILVAILLLSLRAISDFGKRIDDVRINEISHDEHTSIEFDLTFFEVSICFRIYRVEVLDALGRVVADDDAWLTPSFWGKECRIQGAIHVPTGRGTFRIYPTTPTMENVHANHRIDRLTFGKALAGVSSEARSLKTINAKTDRVGAWSYYLSLVPTTSNGAHGYQIAATRTFVELSHPLAAKGSLYFYYEASPVRMHLDNSLSFSKLLHFFARAFGIISGLFAFVGAFREVFFTINQSRPSKKKKSSLVM
jgi:hypothetical protein